MPANAIEAIGGRLSEASPLTSLIEQRNYPSKPTGNCILPYVVFFRASGGDGARLNSTRGTRQHEIRVDCYATSEEKAEEVLAAVVARLDGWQNRPIGVQGCFAQGDADEDIDGDLHVSGQTFSLTFCPQ